MYHEAADGVPPVPGAGLHQQRSGPASQTHRGRLPTFFARKTHMQLARPTPPRFALFKSLDSAPVLGAANGTHLTCEMWCNTHLENEVRTQLALMGPIFML